uniref:Uncharacterized protein n=1 Tax=Panagrolaimus sp. ES5 TaxID=591445 RepID=A0AC34FQ07_9BILA
MSDWFNDEDDDALQLPDIDLEVDGYRSQDLKDIQISSSLTAAAVALEERLQTHSPLNFRRPPSIDEKIFNKIVKEIVSVIDEVIPDAIIKPIGAAFHECGTFLNFAIDEKTREIKSVWFFFGMGVIICDKKGNEIQNISELLVQLWIKKIQIKLHDDGIAQHSDIILKKNSYKLFFEHKTTPAKITLLFCASEALKRSQLIRLYTRLCPNMIQVGYLYNTLIMTTPALHGISNTPLCYLLIHFLQQTNRVGILPQNLVQISSSSVINEQLSPLKTIPKYEASSTNSVALLCYEFAKFYASFNFAIFIIDIGQKELCFWTDSDGSNKSAMGIRCGFTGRNLAKSITSECTEAFVSKMKEIIVAFENGNESEAFPSEIEEFAKKPLPPKSRK